jgi:LAO/AO transport system kinase
MTTSRAPLDPAEKQGAELAARVLDGDWRALARAITWVENDHAGAASLAAALYARTGHAHVIGVTGPQARARARSWTR